MAGAVLDRLGIGRVTTLPELIETLKLLHVAGPLDSNAISSMSCSGGEASLMADAAVSRNVEFRALKPEQLPALRASLGQMVTLSNPLDYHTFVWGDLARQTDAFSAMFAGDYALNLLVLDFPREDRCDGADWMITVSAVAAAAKQTGARAGILATLPENMPETIALQLTEAGIVPLCGISEALVAADIASGIASAWKKPQPFPLLSARIEAGEVATLSEAEAKTELAASGLAVPLGKTAATAREAAERAEQLGFPVALKALGVEHKSEVGAVKLNLWDRNAVGDAAEGMASFARGFLVEKMVERPLAELIVGAVRDPVVGLTLTVGAGGILVELLEDSVVLPLPVTKAEVLERISRLKVRKLIEGYRGNAGSSLEIVADAVVSTAEYVVKNAAQLEELDINPLMVLPDSRGVIAADALIRRRR